MRNLWTWTTIWGLAVGGERVGLGGGGEGRKRGNNCNSINNKTSFFKFQEKIKYKVQEIYVNEPSEWSPEIY